jgi:hypothetical protein
VKIKFQIKVYFNTERFYANILSNHSPQKAKSPDEPTEAVAPIRNPRSTWPLVYPKRWSKTNSAWFSCVYF